MVDVVIIKHTKSLTIAVLIPHFSPTNIINFRPFRSTTLVVHQRTTWPSHTQ